MMRGARLRFRLRMQLGQRYFYRRYLKDKELQQLLQKSPPYFRETVVATLQVGCLRLDVVLFSAKGQLQMGRDFFVKDAPEAPEWICYESSEKYCAPTERGMLLALETLRQQNNLSYTQCCFQRLEGITPTEERKKGVENQAG